MNPNQTDRLELAKERVQEEQNAAEIRRDQILQQQEADQTQAEMEKGAMDVIESLAQKQEQEDRERKRAQKKELEERNKPVVERIEGVEPGQACTDCQARQAKQEQYRLVNFNTTGDKCRTCGSDQILFQEDITR